MVKWLLDHYGRANWTAHLIDLIIISEQIFSEIVLILVSIVTNSYKVLHEQIEMWPMFYNNHNQISFWSIYASANSHTIKIYGPSCIQKLKMFSSLECHDAFFVQKTARAQLWEG